MAQRSDFQLKWQPRPKGGGKQRKQKAESRKQRTRAMNMRVPVGCKTFNRIN